VTSFDDEESEETWYDPIKNWVLTTFSVLNNIVYAAVSLGVCSLICLLCLITICCCTCGKCSQKKSGKSKVDKPNKINKKGKSRSDKYK
jgi:hypothetical protein